MRIVTGMMLALLLAACTPKSIVLDDTFTASDADAQAVFADVVRTTDTRVITGTARASWSGPQGNDRGVVVFSADRTRTYLSLRNNLGIEGYRIGLAADSVTIYDRINRTAVRLAAAEADERSGGVLPTFPLFRVLVPDWSTTRIRRLYESPDAWYFLFQDGRTAVFAKNDGRILRLEFPERDATVWATYLFDDHTTTRGMRHPNKVQVLSRDRKSNIFLHLQSVQIDPADAQFDLRIPSGIRIDRP